MNSWLLLRRLRGPAFIILVGITALLNQWGILRFSRSWPLYLILAGLLGLAERIVLGNATPMASTYPGAYPGGWSGTAYPTPGFPGVVSSTPAAPTTGEPSADIDRRS